MYDIGIIGGGIQGAACALAASEKGYKVLLLEQYERPGLATSSKSSKLIHGGLRYLETGQFKLVQESLRERKHLLQSAPHLVRLVPFHIPVYADSSRPSWMIRLGLTIYALFSGMGFTTIPRKHWQQLDGLKTRQLKTVFQYFDAQTDDQQLTEYVMSQAVKLGTTLETSAVFNAARCDDQACHIQYRKNSQQHEADCRVIINAAGPWVNRVLANITPSPDMLDIDLVLGTHIIVPGQLQQGMYYLESPSDRRAVFVMPWENRILIGTTERHFSGAAETVSPPPEDIDYLIGVYNHYFENKISRQDVIESFAGLRVLPRGSGSFFHRSRSAIIHHDNSQAPRVYTLYGGKLTSHRATARQLISQLNLR